MVLSKTTLSACLISPSKQTSDIALDNASLLPYIKFSLFSNINVFCPFYYRGVLFLAIILLLPKIFYDYLYKYVPEIDDAPYECFKQNTCTSYFWSKRILAMLIGLMGSEIVRIKLLKW